MITALFSHESDPSPSRPSRLLSAAVGSGPLPPRWAPGCLSRHWRCAGACRQPCHLQRAQDGVVCDSFAAGRFLLRKRGRGASPGSAERGGASFPGRAARATGRPGGRGASERRLAERKDVGERDPSAFCFVVGFLIKIRRKCNKDIYVH